MAEHTKGLAGWIESLTPAGLWLAVVAIAAAAALAVCGIGALLLQDSGWWVGWKPVLAALAVVVVVPVVGLWPLGRCDSSDSQRISKAVYSGTPIRLITALLLGLPVLLRLADKADRKAFGIWLGGLYLVSLMAEMVVLAVWLRGRGGSTRV